MKDAIRTIIKESIGAKEALLAEGLPALEKAAACIIDSIRSGGKILVFGNGGSAADSQHFVAEFVGRFRKERPPFGAIALTTNTSTLSAVANDYSYDITFSRQLEALGRKGDVAIGISTSGNSKNVILAIEKASSMGLATIGLSGGKGGRLSKACDICITVPSDKTARVQETHIVIIHILCELVEDALTG